MNNNWANIYTEISKNIYKLSSKDIFNLTKKIEKNTGINSSLGKYGDKINKFDHFSFFGNFNRGITDKNRIKIITYLKKELKLKQMIPDNFGGIPVVNNMNAWFFSNEKDLEVFVKLFNNVVLKKDISELFNKALTLKGCALGKLTSGLFWINSKDFLPLDANTIKFLNYKLNLGIKANNITYKEYIKILDIVKEKLGTNFIQISLNAWNQEHDIVKEKNIPSYWIYAPGENASKWNEFYEKGIMGLGWNELGNLNQYKSKEEIVRKLQEIYKTDSSKKNDAAANYDFLNNMNIGDIIIAKKGKYKYIGYGIVQGNYEFDANLDEYKSIRKVKWINKGEWEETDMSGIVLKTLTNIDKYPDYIEKLKNLLGINSPNKNIMPKSDKTSKILDNKKQIILYGPPGTGKTYNVKNIILNHLGEKFDNNQELNNRYKELHKEGRVEFITFHQSFSYEEFIEGIKPDLDGDSEEINYKIEDGIFKKVVNKAKYNIKSNLNIEENNIINILEKFNEYIKENYLDKGKEYPLLSKVTIKGINENKGSYLLSGSITSAQRLAIKVIERDLLNYINGNIKSYEDIKPIYESERKFHGNARYYFMLYNKLADFIKSNNLKIENNTINKEVKNYYLVIDEINRGNISKIFGELITLLEADKRLGEKNEITTKLPYSKEDFGIPSNLYIVSTMNTSDKSIVSLDTALRRRFGFKEMLPDYTLPGLEKNIEGINLAELLQKINNRIEYLIDKDHLIGHSYFLNTNNLSDLKIVIYNEILPLLEEYFYSEEEKIKLVLGSKFFKKKNFDENLFENKSDFENDDNQYEIIENLSNDEFINALKNIIKTNEEN